MTGSPKSRSFSMVVTRRTASRRSRPKEASAGEAFSRGVLSERTMALTTLQGKNAVITGGARGIGFALAQELLSRGASVCLADIDERALGTASAQLAARLQPGQRVLLQITDVAQPESVAALAEFAWRQLGMVDLLCA